MAKSDPQAVSCEADRTAHLVFPGKRKDTWDVDPQNSHIEVRLLFTT
jgi:hypothetical protein